MKPIAVVLLLLCVLTGCQKKSPTDSVRASSRPNRTNSNVSLQLVRSKVHVGMVRNKVKALMPKATMGRVVNGVVNSEMFYLSDGAVMLHYKDDKVTKIDEMPGAKDDIF